MDKRTRYAELVKDSRKEIKTFLPSNPCNSTGGLFVPIVSLDITGIVKELTTEKVRTTGVSEKEVV